MKPKTSRVLAWLFSLVAVLVLLLFLSVALVYWQPELIKPVLVSALAPEGGSSSLGLVEISLSPPSVTIENLHRRHPQEPAIRVAKLRLDLDPDGIWGTDPWIELLEAEGLQVDIKTNAKEPIRPIDLGNMSLVLAVGQANIINAALNLHTEHGRLIVKVPSLTIKPQKNGKRRLRLDSRVSWSNPANDRLAWAAINGSGSLDLSPSLDLGLTLTQGGLALAELQGPLTGSARLAMSQKKLQLSELSLAVAKGAGRLTPALLKLTGQGDLEGDNAIVKLHQLKLGEQFMVSADFSGSLKDGLSGELAAQGRASLDKLAIQDAQLQAKLAGSLAAPRMDDISLHIPDAALLWQKKKLPTGGITVTGKASLGRDNIIHLDELKAGTERLGTLNGNFSIKNGQLQKAVIRGDAIMADELLALSQRLAGQPEKGWQAQGKLKLTAELGRDRPGQWHAALTSTDLGFSSADGMVLVGQLAGQLTASGKLKTKPIVHARLKLRSGQALWGTVFLDLAKAPFELSSQARMAALDNLRQIKFKGQMKGYGRFSGKGDLALTGGALRHQGSLLLTDLNMAKLFNTFVRDPLSAYQPDLASWRVKGQARLEVKGKGKGVQTNLKGRMRLNRAELQTGQGTRLERLDMDLPFTYIIGGRAPTRPTRPDRRSWGKVTIRGLSAPGLDLKQLELPVAVTPNRLWTLGAVNVPLADGKAVITNLQVDNPLSPDFHATFTTQLDGINLAKLAGPTLPLSGSLAGRLPEVSLTRQLLKAKGRLEGSVFGGTLIARSLAVELPFNPGREIRADVKARQIHLEPLSQALQVGRITGRLDAELKGLRLAYGQPVAFQLMVESVEVPGVDQQVSLRAVNSISLLGTGAGLSGMGLNLFASFFKEFPYAKIAFSCKLKNDEFRVRGLIHEDGVEYLVKRPLLMGINVINRNPDNRISFSDMLERLQRVQQDNAPRPSEAEAKEKR